MKCWIFSDLHVDVDPLARGPRKEIFSLPDPQPEHDCVIIAGDVREDPVKSIQWIANAGFRRPVVFVCGNHEWYGCTFDSQATRAREEAAKHPEIHFLQNDTVVIGGVRFIGATLWTDYLLHGEPHQWFLMFNAKNAMRDHRKIRMAPAYRRFLPDDALVEHQTSAAYIDKMLSTPHDGATVVVTHHSPCAKSIPERYAGDTLNGAYHSHLDHLVDRATLWVHGHIHQATRYKLGDGEVVANPRGYASLGEQSGWNRSLVVDIS